METIKAALRSDRHVKPTMRTYRRMTAGELVARRTYESLDRNGKVANVKVTSIKTWKTRSDIEVHCQFGKYEHWTETYASRDALTDFVQEVKDAG